MIYYITLFQVFQYSFLKTHGKGSLLLPCSKMPFCIFLFSLKTEFQEKSHFARKVPEKGYLKIICYQFSFQS